MNLSFKDFRFIIEALEHQINTYQARLQVIEDVDEDEAADLGNDIKFLELLLADMKRNLDHNTSVKPLSSHVQALEPAWMQFAGVFKDDPDFQEIMDGISAERNSDDDSEIDPSYYL
ncbi:hypothetical protein BCD67_25610 [Oscillatoriales cyanobacterium USR001]|nr:hypothetical protein BCD67_25610 [Oscillatoriales cyanobacterium USR001]